MLEITLFFIMCLGGLILLVKGSDWLTDSLIPVAKKLGTTYIAIASILVSIVLSLPEIFVSIYAFFEGYVGIGISGRLSLM